ncbi:tenascin-like isoform X1 [Pelobates cultripes]|uniref:Tenascin-like isoform X1 n=2 Tax=Pelobates cultripes TaxID=61616 RepID=A0AAD1SY96_PELCU|nr:tenascin-like isoform X1 [Pelobates cultripes]
MSSPLTLYLLVLCFGVSLPAPSSTTTQCADAGVQSLLKRLEILEKLVRDIKGQCTPPCCANSQTGADDPSSLKSPPCPQDLEDCPGGCGGDSQGVCVDGQCQCKEGYMGDRCQLRTCPEDCNDQGRCVDGRCFCFEGYFGLNCGSKGCLNNCQNHGQCEDGVCVCDSGFLGEDCSIKTCPSNCLNRGKCENGVCVCASGFTGVDCGIRTCPRNCHNRGRCQNGVCICRTGFTGADCGSRLCPNNCQQRGHCEDGVCTCNPGFTGVDCSSKKCPNDCQNNGRCENGVCICDSGFSGVDCSSRPCPEDCNEQGQCVSGVCVCDTGFIGEDCGTRICSEECERNGRCEDGECVCDPGYTGTDCEIRTCPDDCHSRGRCDDGKCVCDSGYTGLDCGSRTCPNKCNNRGRCEDGNCICNSGFSGPDCGSKMCPKNCSGNGQCVNGKCVCDAGFVGPICGTRTCPVGCARHGRCVRGMCVCSPGYTGPDCGSRTCPKNCLNQGTCEDGTCVCDSGYTGLDCGTRTCPNDCHNQGQCEDGTCVCDDGYTGVDCELKSCPNDCYKRGQCKDGVCICDSGYTGLNCELKTCPNDCHNHGECKDGVCICDSGYTGLDCESKTCPNNCNNRGRCEDGECICDWGYTDLDCGSRTCPNDCQNHGRCDDGECICDSGYSGPDCGLRTCPSDCNNRGNCVDGLCVCISGYYGPDCGFKACLNDCNNRGLCEDGVCICDSWYTGLDCGSRSCPNNCQNRGRCDDGTCVCDAGFAGLDCSSTACPDNCYIHGRCEDGVCICRPGYTGLDCGSKACPKNCNDNGQCVNGKCVCNPGFSGPVCGARSCPRNCAGRGKCINGICVCKKGYGGVDCGEVVTEITAVTGLQVTSQEESAVTLEWDQPQSTPDSYEISFKAEKENGLIQTIIDGSLTTYRQIGLAPGEVYIVTIQPRKDQTLGPDTSINATTRIEAPHGLRVTDITTSSFLLRWDRPQNLPDRYIITLVTPSGKERKLKVPGKGDKARLTGLDEGTKYRVLLKAEKGQEQSEAVETTVNTAFGKERKRLDVVDEHRVQEPEVTSQSNSRLEKSLPSQEKAKHHPASSRSTVSSGEVGEHSLNTDESKEIIAEDQYQKGDKTIHTTRRQTHTITTIINRYYTIYHENGSVSVLKEAEEFDEKNPLHKLVNGEDQEVMTSVVEEGDVEDGTLTHIREKIPGSKVGGWVVTRNITHFGSPQKVNPHTQYPEAENSGLIITSDTTSEEGSLGVGSSAKETTSTSGEVGIRVNPYKKPSSQHNLQYPKIEKQVDQLSKEVEPGTIFGIKHELAQSGVESQTNATDDPKDSTKSRQNNKIFHRVVSISKKVERYENGKLQNETKVLEDPDRVVTGIKYKNQTKKLPFFAASSMKAVIENLPEKLSPFNGTFIQRLESYLRATSYPLRPNQTVESVAKAIFLYLVKWKPHNFTGMVYDRLPQKTPGASGNPEPAGTSRLQGNVGRVVMESDVDSLGNATDRIHETSALVQKGKKLKTPENTPRNIIDIETLGRVEAVGEVGTPTLLNAQTHSSSEENEDGVIVKTTLEVHDRQMYEEDLSKSGSSKIVLDKKHTKKPYNNMPVPKNATSAQKKQQVDETKTKKTAIKHEKESDKPETEKSVTPGIGTLESSSYHIPKIREEEKGNSLTHSSHLKNKSRSITGGTIEEPSNYNIKEKILLEDKRDHLPVVTEKDPNIHSKVIPFRQESGKEILTEEDEDLRNIHLIDDSLLSSETNKKVLPFENREERKKETGQTKLVVNKIEGFIEEQEKNKPTKSPYPVKVHGPGRQGRPTILQRNSTTLVISLEGLGILWEKVLVLYHPLHSTTKIAPSKLEVERGVREVEIGGLEPGTSYRLDLHGIVKGRSSKSFSLVTDTAVVPTTVQPEVETTTQSTTPPPEVVISTAAPVTKKPQGIVAQMGALQVREVTSETVTLVWKARPGVYESFLIGYEDVTDISKPQETSVPGDQREVTLSDLSQNTRYSVSVYGVRNGKLSRPLKVEVTTDSDPDRGTSPRLSPIAVSEIQPDSFLMSWEPLDGDFDSYIIQYFPPGGPRQEITLRGDETSYRITELITKVNYTVEIRGIWGDKYSEVETVYVLTEKPLPPRMESLSLSDVQSDSLRLTWEVQGGEFDSFLLYYRDGEGKPQEIPLDRDLRTFTVSDLKPGKKYKFVVYGIEDEKRSKPVTVEAITEKLQPPRLESLSVSDIYTESVRLSWEVHSGEFDSFLLYYRDAEGKPKEVTLESELRMVEVDDLRPGKKYKFVLHGVSGGKKGKGVIVETTTAPRDKPVEPSKAPPSAPRLVDLQASEVGKDSVKLSWTVEGEVSFDWIVVQYREPEGGVREVQVQGQDINTIISGLLPSRKYKFNVYGLRGEKRSKPLSTEIETGYPEVIGPSSSVLDDLYITPRGPHAILVSWEVPDNSFDSFIVRYGLPEHVAPLNEMLTDGSARSLLISGLQPDTLYNVTLSGIQSGKEQGMLKGKGRTGPLDLEPPQNLRFDEINESSVVAKWDPPNAETTTFKVSYQLAEGGEPESVNVVGTSTSLKDLTPGAQYEVTVVSVRGFEESQPLSGYVTTGGGGPRALRVFDVSEVSALLRWEPPQGHVDKYIVIYKAENVPAITMDVPGDRTELPLSSLYPHTEYFASVQSVRESETSKPTSTSFTTSANTARDLSASQITARSALLTWKAPPTIPDGYLLIYQTPDGRMKEISLPHNLTNYTMSQLDPLTQYRVQLHSIHGGTKSAPISTSFTTVRLRYPFPRDCWEQRMNGEVHNGIFTIHLEGEREETMMVYCDMETDGGGWIVFQRRMDGSTDFYRDWKSYKMGFGNLTSEFWLGNIALHKLSSSAPSELRVDLRAGDEAAYAVYDDFIVESEDRHFRLRLGAYKGNAGDSLSYHNNMIFSTRDRDAQKRILPCSVSYHGAWWYRNCHFTNLNGLYNNNKDHQGMNWYTWKGFEFSIPFTEMKMRPRGGGNRNRL